MILLSPEEIDKLDNELVDIPEWINETDEYKSFLFSRRYFAKAQLKKMVEILAGYQVDMDRGDKDKVPMVYLRLLKRDWQALLKEIE